WGGSKGTEIGFAEVSGLNIETQVIEYPHLQAVCTVDGRTGEYVAHEAEGETYERFWRLAEAAYPGFPRYKERAAGRHIPIMVLEPKEE
ncbi:MAG TPA: DUF385 domain-containing protein, partial [Anaerolineae bacterium]|nr:DUF385 domain-containing protein [Anaerolineae bacterium]